ncbi:DNA polymerase Y family protein [Brevibacterium otitidis]|uniref:DNA polymerase Y family protein n=1 Tax=Brevibacterium otitidis TaxID=53364 RepID=A0ABV5X528_9MICO|nr:DNA polymerase Y family protein [Brevibacterium otitidis]
MAAETQRTLVLTIPDWSAAAAAEEHGWPVHEPTAVLRGGRIVSCNAAARAAGITTGINKRAAQLRCPQLHIAGWDEDVDQRIFATGLQVFESSLARFTVLTPGEVSIPLAALARTYPSEDAAVEELLTTITDATGWELFAGIADSVFAALLAARTATRVLPGATAEFLAAQPVTALAYADAHTYGELVTVFERLGLDTLGALAQLSEGQMRTRFGTLGVQAHRLARGLPVHRPVDHRRVREHHIEVPISPPSTRSDELSFHARAAATELFSGIRAASLVCPSLTIELTAAGGQRSERTWRVELMDENLVADRVRWQAEGWLAGQQPQQSAGAGLDESADEGLDEADGVCALTLSAAELLAPLEAHTSLFAQHSGAVTHTLERLQGLYGPEAVRVPQLQGGREPAETNLWTPWQQQPRPERSAAAPWPGRLPGPHPMIVERTPVELLDRHGLSVIARPSGLDSAPALLRLESGAELPVVDHSSAWPVEAGWWDPARAQYRVRLQVLTAGGQAFLLCKEHGQWQITGRYA